MKDWRRKSDLGGVSAAETDAGGANAGVRFEFDGEGYHAHDETPMNSARATMHWHTPRQMDFKKVLDWKRYEEEEKNRDDRDEEAMEAWQAITGSTGGTDAEAEAAMSVKADQLKTILDEFDLKVDLAEIGLKGEEDEQGNTVISFDTFQQFTALTPRLHDGLGDEAGEPRTVAGTLQMHPGSPIHTTKYLHRKRDPE